VAQDWQLGMNGVRRAETTSKGHGGTSVTPDRG
jgi:hypothetical protein